MSAIACKEGGETIHDQDSVHKKTNKRIQYSDDILTHLRKQKTK